MFLYWAGRECESFNQASQTRRCVSLSGCLLVRLLPIGVIVRVGAFLVGAIRRSSSGLERSSMPFWSCQSDGDSNTTQTRKPAGDRQHKSGLEAEGCVLNITMHHAMRRTDEQNYTTTPVPPPPGRRGRRRGIIPGLPQNIHLLLFLLFRVLGKRPPAAHTLLSVCCCRNQLVGAGSGKYLRPQTFPICILLGLALPCHDFLLFLLRFQSLIGKVHLHRPICAKGVRDEGELVLGARAYFRRWTSSSISMVLEA
jgi:hypothetical protein